MFERHKTPKMTVHPGQQDDGQGVIARLEADEQLSASGGWHEKGIAGEWAQVHHAPFLP